MKISLSISMTHDGNTRLGVGDMAIGRPPRGIIYDPDVSMHVPKKIPTLCFHDPVHQHSAAARHVKSCVSMDPADL